MSKYIIDLRPDCKVVQQICASDGNVNVGARSVGLLDELTDDYVKENFKDLLKGEYQRGLEDGKWKSEDGCTGCKYEGKTGEHLPCEYCMNNFKNQWEAKDTYYDIIRNSIHNWVTELNVKLEDISKVLEDMKHD